MSQVDHAHLAARRAAMLAAVPVGVVLLDAAGQVVESNPAAQRLLGLADDTPDSWQDVARRLADPVSGTPLPAAELPWQRALAGERVDDRDLALVTPPPDSSRRLIAVSARPFHDPVSRAAGALVVIAVDRPRLAIRDTRDADLPPYLRRVLALVGQGRGTAEIASELNLTLATTRLYIKRLYLRLGVSSRSQLALRAIEMGL